MKTKVFFITVILAVLCSCKVKTNVAIYQYSAPTYSRLEVIQTGQKLPDGLLHVGSVTVGEGGFTPTKKCTYQACMDVIQQQGQMMGGEYIYIVSIKEPDVWGSTCYNIVADIYRRK